MTEYRLSSEWSVLAPATHREYNVRLRDLESWAMDGTLALVQLDTQMVVDLKEAMLTRKPVKKDDEPRVNPNLHRTAATLRVLRLLLNWAMLRGYVTSNATAAVPIPTIAHRGAPARTGRCRPRPGCRFRLPQPRPGL